MSPERSLDSKNLQNELVSVGVLGVLSNSDNSRRHEVLQDLTGMHERVENGNKTELGWEEYLKFCEGEGRESDVVEYLNFVSISKLQRVVEKKKKKRGIDLGVAVDTVNVMRDEEGGWEIVEKPKDKENARKQMKRILSGDPYFVINSIAVGPVNDLRGFLSLSVHALPIRIEVEEGQRERLEKEWMRKYEERVLKGRDITPGGISQVDLLVLPHLRVFLSDNGFYLLEKKNETELMGLMEQVEKEEVGEFVSFLEIEEGEKEEIGTVIAGCSKEGMSEAFFNWVRVVQVLGSSEYPVGKKMHKVVDDMMQGSGLSSGVFYR